MRPEDNPADEVQPTKEEREAWENSQHPARGVQELRRLLNCKDVTPLPWKADAHDCNSVETTYVAMHAAGKSIFDTANSEVMCIESEDDGEGSTSHVDRNGMANLRLSAAAVNALPGLILMTDDIREETEKWINGFYGAGGLTSAQFAGRILAIVNRDVLPK